MYAACPALSSRGPRGLIGAHLAVIAGGARKPNDSLLVHVAYSAATGATIGGNIGGGVGAAVGATAGAVAGFIEHLLR